MTVGYTDYARLSQQGGFQLYAISGSPPQNTVLLREYIGAWPYVNLFTNCGASSDICRIAIAYFSDSTYTTQVGFRYAVRTGGMFAATQYANLSPWVQLSYTTISSNTFPFTALGLYAAVAPARQVGLSSTDVPIIGTNQTIAGPSNGSITPGHIQPGSASLMIYTTATAWSVNAEYYDYGTPGYLQIFHADQVTASHGGVFDVPMLDAPHLINFSNNGSTNGQFVISWQSK